MGTDQFIPALLSSIGQFFIMIVMLVVLMKACKVLDAIAEMIKKNID